MAFGGDDFFNDTYIEDFDDESESIYLDTFNEDESSLNTNQSEADHDHELKTVEVEELVGADLPHIDNDDDHNDNAYNCQSSVWGDYEGFGGLLATQNTNNCDTLHDVNKIQDKTPHLKGWSSEQHFDQNTLLQPLAQNTHDHHADSDTSFEETLRNISLNSANFWHATQQTCLYNENSSLEFKDQIQRSVSWSQSEQACVDDFGFFEDDSSEDSKHPESKLDDSNFVLQQHFGAMNLEDNLFSKGENTGTCTAVRQHSLDVTEVKSSAAILNPFFEHVCNMHLYKIRETSTNNEAALHVSDEYNKVDCVDERGSAAAGIIHSLHPVQNTPSDPLTASEMDKTHQEDVRYSSSPFGSLEPLFAAKLSSPLLPVTCVSVLSHNDKHISDETDAQESHHISSSGQMHQASISSGKNYADNELLAQRLTPVPFPLQMPLDPVSADITEDHVKYLSPLDKIPTGTFSHLQKSCLCHPEKQCSVVGSNQKPNILRLLTQSSVSTLSSSWPSDLQPELQIQDQTETEMTADADIFTRTEMFHEAYDALFNTDLHRVVILGIPSSGKGTLGRALLRAGQNRGMEPHIIKSFEEWRVRIGGRATGESYLADGLPGPSQSSPITPLNEIVPQSQIVLLKHIFGYEFLQIDVLNKWRQVFSLMETFCAHNKVYLVLIVNCHVLKALREGFSEVQTLFPLQCDVEMKSPNPEDKEKMLLLHLKNEVQPQRLSKLINDKLLKPVDVIACDNSKSLFPRCCQIFVGSINTYVPPQNPAHDADNFKCHVRMCAKIFSRPAPIFTAFVLNVWHMMENSQITLLAAFSLLLAHKDVDNADIVLDFCSNHKLADSCFYPHSLKLFLRKFRGTLVKDDCKDFVNRHAYEGTALALAKYCPNLVIAIVDWSFLIKRCIVPLKGMPIESYLKPYVIEVKREKGGIACPEYQALTQRIARSLQNKDEMILAVQHPALSIIEFRDDVQTHVTDGNLRDSYHSQTALFWSLFNSSPHFTDFIFKKCGPHKKEDLVTAALACCVLRGKEQTLKTFVKYWCKVTKESSDSFLLGKTVEKRILPLPKGPMAISDDWRKQLKHLKYHPVNNDSNKYVVSEIDVSWPPLHLAVQYNNLEVVKFLMEEHPETLCVLDQYKRTVLHVAARFSELDVVTVLLQDFQFRPLISLCDHFGNTPLHDACYRGHEEIVKILNNACRDWKTIKNRLNLTAVDLALSEGYSDIASLLK